MENQVPCPFCGEHRIIALELNVDEWMVECIACGAVGPTRSTPNGAWKAWNLRRKNNGRDKENQQRTHA